MRKVCTLIRVVLAAAASLAGLNAQAMDLGRVAAAFGNTVMTIYPDGRTQKIWLHPDGSWDGTSRRNEPLSGKWTLKGDKVCLRQSKPPTLPFSYCTGFPEDPPTIAQMRRPVSVAPMPCCARTAVAIVFLLPRLAWQTRRDLPRRGKRECNVCRTSLGVLNPEAKFPQGSSESAAMRRFVRSNLGRGWVRHLD